MEYMEKYKDIQFLYDSYFNTDLDLEDFSGEFYFFVGELLKGKSIEDLKSNVLPAEFFKNKEFCTKTV